MVELGAIYRLCVSVCLCVKPSSGLAANVGNAAVWDGLIRNDVKNSHQNRFITVLLTRPEPTKLKPTPCPFDCQGNVFVV